MDSASASQVDKAPEGAKAADTVFLSNEPNGTSAIVLEFDVESVAFRSTPLARIQMPDITKAQVKRPGQKPTAGKGAVHALIQQDGAAGLQLVGSTAVKPTGIPMRYMIE